MGSSARSSQVLPVLPLDQSQPKAPYGKKDGKRELFANIKQSRSPMLAERQRADILSHLANIMHLDFPDR